MGAAFAASVIAGWFYGNPEQEAVALPGFAVSIALTWLAAGLCYYRSVKGSRKIFRKEALCSVGLGWLLATVVGALPYCFILRCSVVDGVFESASGLTTTGATVFDQLEGLPRSLLFWRAISQWIGGMGVVIFFVAVLAFLGAEAKILFANESSAEVEELDSGRVRSGILHLLYIYLGLSLACFLAFRWGGMGSYEALCHMFTTISTGGFSIYDSSIGYFQSPLLEWMFMVFMVLGGTSFLVQLRVVHGEGRFLLRNTEVRWFCLLLLGSTLWVAVELWRQSESLPGTGVEHGAVALRVSLFHVISLMTTTGFVTVDYDSWPLLTHVLLLALIIVGGCSGSTSGGLKVIRLVAIVKILLIHIENAFRSQVVRLVKINGRSLSTSAKDEILLYVILIVLLGHVAMIAITVLEPQLSFKGIYSVTLACLYNIGPGFAEIGPMHTYASFSAPCKSLLVLLMIMGRLELYAILALFLPSFWRRFA